ACRTNSTGVGPLSRPTSTAGWSAPNSKVRWWVRSSPTPKKPWIVLRLCVPSSHSLAARNWNLAACGAALTAFRGANRVAVSTPLRVVGATFVVTDGSFLRVWISGTDELVGAECGRLGRSGIDGRAELLLQLDELGHGRVTGQRAGQLEDRA